MNDWCECHKPDFPDILDADYLTSPGVCRNCKKKRKPIQHKGYVDLKAYCPQRHMLKNLEVIFNVDWKNNVVHYISGYCEVCDKTFCVGDDMTQTGVEK